MALRSGTFEILSAAEPRTGGSQRSPTFEILSAAEPRTDGVQRSVTLETLPETREGTSTADDEHALGIVVDAR